MKTLFSITILIGILCSCSVKKTLNNTPFQKRKYSKGFYFDKKSNVQQTNKKTIIDQIEVKIAEELIQLTQSIAISDNQNKNKSDTATVLLKTGIKIKGIIKEKNKKGILLLSEEGKMTYIDKNDITSINGLSFSKKKAINQTSQKSISINKEKTRREHRPNSNDTIPIIIELIDGQIFKGCKTIGMASGKMLILNENQSVLLKNKDIKTIKRGDTLEYDSKNGESFGSGKTKLTGGQILAIVFGGILMGAFLFAYGYFVFIVMA